MASLIHSCLGRWNLNKTPATAKKNKNKSGTQTTSLAIIAIRGLMLHRRWLTYLLACLFVSRRVSASASTKISVGVNKGCISKAIRS